MAKYEVSINGKKYEVEIAYDDGQRAIVNVDGQRYEVDARSVTATPSYSHQRQTSPSPPPESNVAADPASSPTAEQSNTASATHAPSSGPDREKKILAPMPGVILEIKVSIGSKVKPGDVVARMEAMKMENDIKSDFEGTVKEIPVQKGDGVQERDVILVLEE